MSERTRAWVFWGLLGIELLGFAAWQLLHLGGFQWSTDEGTYLMRVRLMQQGYRLYADIWTDQLPGLILLLRGVFAVVGSSVEAGRALIVLLSCVGLLGLALLIRYLGGRVGALVTVPLLAIGPNVYWLSRAIVSPDWPSISLGVAALAALQHHLATRRAAWRALSGLLFAIALYIKATAVLALLPAGLWLLLDACQRRESLWRGIWAVVAWVLWVLLPFGLALWPHHLAGLWAQFVGTQVESGRMALKIGPHAVKIVQYFGEDHRGLLALGLAGLVIACSRRRAAFGLGGIWLLISLLVLLLRSPLWPSHHLVVLWYPLALLAGVGLSEGWSWLRRRTWRRWESIVLGIALLFALISLPRVLAANGELSWAPTYQSSVEGVAFLQEHVTPGAVVISDYQMIPFRAGCIVPPELATVTKKRLQLGLLSSAELVRITQEAAPEAILFWDEQLTRAPEYLAWVQQHYALAYKHNYHEIHLAPVERHLQHRQEALLGEQVRLLGYGLSPLAADPGEELMLTLFWRALAPIEERYHGFAHLIAANGAPVAQDDHVAMGELYPSTAWQVGQIVADTYRLKLPEDAPWGPHILSIGLYDRATKKRLEARDAQGTPLSGDQVALSVQPVVQWPGRFRMPPVEQRTDLHLGSVAQLVGYEVVQQGSTLMVRLVWQALDGASWPGRTVFVHLRRQGQVVAQHDGVPADGRRPLYAWRTHEYIEDEHRIALPSDLVGVVDLFVGMYDPITGVREPAFDGEGNALAGAELRLGAVSLRSRP